MGTKGVRQRAARVLGFFVIALVLCSVFGVVLAQRPEPLRETEPVALETATAEEGIVRGQVVAVSDDRIAVRSADGVVRKMSVNATTLVISDEEDFSIANMPEIQLEMDDIAKGDLVEVVIEPDTGELKAGIVTRLSLFDSTAVAKRN